MQHVRTVFVALMVTAAAFAQDGGAAAPAPQIGFVTGGIDAAAQSANLDLQRVRIEKWKAQGGQQAGSGPPKKIIVDNEAPPAKKTVHKKKPAAAAAPATSPK